MSTKIPWTDETLNVVTGCTRISPGCKHCYAEPIIKRFGHQGKGEDDNKVFNDVVMHPDRLEVPRKWKKPKSIFLCSMGDLFHYQVPSDFIFKVSGMMGSFPRHTFLVLTKRPQRAIDYINLVQESFTPNVWIGVSVEDQESADERIPRLLNIPGRRIKRFVSVEPMLEKIDLTTWLGISEGDPGRFARDTGSDLDWVIAGCESGPKRRPVKTDCFRSLRDQCVTAGVPFFLKQMDVGGKIVKMPVLDRCVWAAKP